MLLNDDKEPILVDSKEILHNIEEAIIKLNKMLDKSNLSVDEVSDIKNIFEVYAKALNSNIFLTDVILEVKTMLKEINIHSDIGKKIINDIEEMFSSRLEKVGNNVKDFDQKLNDIIKNNELLNIGEKIENIENLEEDISFGDIS